MTKIQTKKIFALHKKLWKLMAKWKFDISFIKYGGGIVELKQTFIKEHKIDRSLCKILQISPWDIKNDCLLCELYRHNSTDLQLCIGCPFIKYSQIPDFCMQSNSPYQFLYHVKSQNEWTKLCLEIANLEQIT